MASPRWSAGTTSAATPAARLNSTTRRAAAAASGWWSTSSPLSQTVAPCVATSTSGSPRPRLSTTMCAERGPRPVAMTTIIPGVAGGEDGRSRARSDDALAIQERAVYVEGQQPVLWHTAPTTAATANDHRRRKRRLMRGSRSARCSETLPVGRARLWRRPSPGSARRWPMA